MPSNELMVGNPSPVHCTDCTDEDTRPVVLPCLHCFCTECYGKSGATKCPECGDTTSSNEYLVSELYQTSLLGRRILDINKFLRAQDCRVSCRGCSSFSEVAECSYCLDCQEYFCENCTRLHKNFGFAALHRLLKRSEMEGKRPGDLIGQSVRFCEQHPEAEEIFYCCWCETPLCEMCHIEQHSDCECVLPIDAAILQDGMSVIIEGYLGTMKRQILEGKEFLAALGLETQKLLADNEEARQGLDLREKLAKETVSHFSKVRLNELEALSKQKFATLDSEIKVATQEFEELQQINYTMRNCLKIASPSDFIFIESTERLGGKSGHENHLRNWNPDVIHFEESLDLEKTFAEENIGDIFGYPDEVKIILDENSILEYKESLNCAKPRQTQQVEKVNQQPKTINYTGLGENENTSEMENTTGKFDDTHLVSSTPNPVKVNLKCNNYVDAFTSRPDYSLMESRPMKVSSASGSELPHTADSGFYSPTKSSLSLCGMVLTISPAVDVLKQDLNGSDHTAEDDLNAMVLEEHPCNAVLSDSDSSNFHTAKTGFSRDSLCEELSLAEENFGLQKTRSKSDDTLSRDDKGKGSEDFGSLDKLINKEKVRKHKEKSKKKARDRKKLSIDRCDKGQTQHQFISNESQNLTEIPLNSEKSPEKSKKKTGARKKLLIDRCDKDHTDLIQHQFISNESQNLAEIPLNSEKSAEKEFLLPANQTIKNLKHFDSANDDPSTFSDHHEIVYQGPFSEVPDNLELKPPKDDLRQSVQHDPEVIRVFVSPSHGVSTQDSHTEPLIIGNIAFDWAFPKKKSSVDFSEPSSDSWSNVSNESQTSNSPKSSPSTMLWRQQNSKGSRDFRKKPLVPYDMESALVPAKLPYDAEHSVIFYCKGEIHDDRGSFGVGNVKVVVPKGGLPTVRLEWEEELCTIRPAANRELDLKRVEQLMVALKLSDSEKTMLEFEAEEHADNLKTTFAALFKAWET